MILRRALTWLLWVVVPVIVWSQQPSDLKPVADQLAASIYTGSSMATLRELTDGIGGRVTGTPSYVSATEWAAAKFRSYGIENVRLDPFTIPAGWERGSASGRMVAPLSRPLYVASVGWSPSTAAGGVQALVAAISDLAPEKLQAVTDQLQGKIVFLDMGKILAEGYAKALPKLDAAWPVFQEAGVVTVIMADHETNDVLNAHTMSWNAKLLPLPVAEVGMEDGALIQRELEHGPVTIQISLENKTAGETKVNNVIAEIRGRERPNEWILIGAHLDSWDFGTGAQDNGTGAITVLEVARAMKALGKAPRRSVRFALWGGEEEGILGSYAYVHAHKSELKNCAVVLNTDNGSGHPKGWKVEGREDLREAMQPWSDGLLQTIGGGDLSMETTYDTDHGPFLLQGIPALDLWVDMSKYFEMHHKSSDTLDKVDLLHFKAGEAIVAVTAYALAESEKPIARHIDHEAVEEILKNAKLDELLEHVGVWKP